MSLSREQLPKVLKLHRSICASTTLQVFQGTRHTVVFKEALDKPNSAKALNAIAPNIIHSLDSTYLQALASKCHSFDIPLVAIHDCFLVRLTDYDFLKTQLVQQFIVLYTQTSFLHEFHAECLAQIKGYGYTIENGYVVGEAKGDLRIPRLPPIGDSIEFKKRVEKAHYLAT